MSQLMMAGSIHYIDFFDPKIVSRCARDNLRGQKSLGPLTMSLEMAQKVIVPQKKIMSRSFLNSGTLIVIILQTGV
jgi:hypothetical protein